MGHRALCSLVIALAAWSCGGDRTSVPGDGEASGATTTRIPIVGLEGVEAALAAKRGKACLLNFWATWCPPCVAELPELVAVGRRYESQSAVVLGVSYDLMVSGVDEAEVPGMVEEFLADRGLDLETVVYDAPDYDAINARFDLPGPVPVTIAFDATGKEVDRHVGQADEARFESMMKKALGR